MQLDDMTTQTTELAAPADIGTTAAPPAAPTTEAPADIAQQEQSLRDTLLAAREATKAPKTTEAADTGQPRGPDGKFAPKADDQAKAAATDPATLADPNRQAAATPPPAADKVPDSVPAALRDKFAGLDPDLQQWFRNREADVHKQFTRNDAERNFGKALKDVITPYMPMIQAEGGNPVLAVQSLLNTAYVLRTGSPEQKAQALRTVAEQFNIPIDGIASPQPFVDPVVETLQQRIDRLERERIAEAKSRQMAEQASIQTEIEQFASQPGREHFEQVRDRMSALLSSGQAKDLQDAYDQAVWADPNLRSTLLEQREREAELQRQQEAKARADAARRASGSVFGGPGAHPATAAAANRSLRDEIKAQLAVRQGRI